MTKTQKLEAELYELREKNAELFQALTKAKSDAPLHEHDYVPMPGEPYEKRSATEHRKMDAAVRYLSFYCRRCPATHEAIAADYRAKGGS